MQLSLKAAVSVKMFSASSELLFAILDNYDVRNPSRPSMLGSNGRVRGRESSLREMSSVYG